MKTLFRAIFGLCLMAMFWMPMSAQESATRGDVDNDKDVTISDVTALIDYLLKGSDDPLIAVAADVDQDNTTCSRASGPMWPKSRRLLWALSLSG